MIGVTYSGMAPLTEAGEDDETLLGEYTGDAILEEE